MFGAMQTILKSKNLKPQGNVSRVLLDQGENGERITLNLRGVSNLDSLGHALRSAKKIAVRDKDNGTGDTYVEPECDPVRAEMIIRGAEALRNGSAKQTDESAE